MGELLDIAKTIAGAARDGEQIQAHVSRTRDTDVRVYEAGVEQLTTADRASVVIRVIRNGRTGSAVVGTLEETAVKEALEDARDNAEFGTPDEFSAVADPDGVAHADIDPYDAELESFPTDRKIEIALGLEKMLTSSDKRIRAVESVDYSDNRIESAVANSHGVFSEARRTAVGLVGSVIAGEVSETQTGYGVSVSRKPSGLDLEKARSLAVDRAVRMLGATKPQSGKVTVVLEPNMSAALLSIIGGTLTGDTVLKGRSLFADRVGEEVAAPFFSLVEDPTDATAWASSRADAEGLATRRVGLIQDGVLEGFLYDSYSARKAGTASTGSATGATTPMVGFRALTVGAGSKSQAEIIASIEDGVLVQEMSGLHSGVNPISGDFSVGATGLRIRNGQLAEPIREFTIGSTIQRMLKDLVAVGNDLEWSYGSAIQVTLAIGDVAMAGV
jgi:PmbA protein